MEQNVYGLSRDFIIHPGETLKEILEDHHMSQKELAIRCGVSEKHISTVISGQKNISPDFAKKLEYAFGIDAIFWLNLQANYDKELLEFEELNSITAEELEVLNNLKFILAEYEKINIIPSGLSKVDSLLEFRRVLNISNLLDIPKLTHIGAYRIKNKNANIDCYVMYAWVKLCEYIDKENNEIAEIKLNVGLLDEMIPQIKRVMFHNAEDIVLELKALFSKCGINFNIVKSFKGAPVQGYIRRNDKDGISLFMTIRGSFADIFWFSLFHEIAHILNGDAKNSFIDFESMPEEIEVKANKLAANKLITLESYNAFLKENDFSINSIKKLASINNVQPYICIGRLMNDHYLKWNQFTNYRLRYKLVD